MAGYEVLILPSAAKELEAIDSREDRRRVADRIAALAENPRPSGSEKLSGLERYRVRQGRYRILYEIEDARLIVVVVRVGDRKDVYRKDAKR